MSSPPSAPVVYPKPRVQGTTLKFWWYPPADSGSSPITHYTLFTTNGSGFTKTYPAGVQFSQILNMELGTTYIFKITATNSYGTSPAASFIPVACCYAPDPPVSISSFTNDINNSITTTWLPPQYTGGAPITYNLVSAYPITNDAELFVQRPNVALISQNYMENIVSSMTYNVLVQCRNYNTYSPQTSFSRLAIFGFQPTSIEGLTLWLDAADLSTLFTDSYGITSIGLNGTYVSSWLDKSNSYILYLVQTLPSLTRQMPTLPALSYPSISSDSTGYFEKTNVNLSTSASISIFVVFMIKSTTYDITNDQSIIRIKNTNTDNESNLTVSIIDSKRSLSWSINGHVLTVYTRTEVPLNVPILGVLTYDATNIANDTGIFRIVRPTSQIVSDATFGHTDNTWNPTTVQILRNMTGVQETSNLFEMLVYNSYVPEETQNSIVQYLIRKWNL